MRRVPNTSGRTLSDLLICGRDSRSNRQGTSISVRGSCIFSGVYIGKVKAISPRKIKYDSSRRASGRTATSTAVRSCARIQRVYWVNRAVSRGSCSGTNIRRAWQAAGVRGLPKRRGSAKKPLVHFSALSRDGNSILEVSRLLHTERGAT